MEQTISWTKLVRHFSRYFDRVVQGRERFVVVQNDKPVAELRPLQTTLTVGELPTVLASLPVLADDDAATFAEDIIHARAELTNTPLKNPWAS